MKFYEMGDGHYIAEAHRGITIETLRELQRQEWARRHGGICRIVTLTEERSIYFAMNTNIREKDNDNLCR